MMTKKRVLVFLFAIGLLVPLFSVEQYPHSLGVQVGRLSGIGASYQKWTDTFGYQVAGGLIYHPVLDAFSDQLVYNFGFELQYPLVRHQVNKWLGGTLYLAVGVHHQGYKEVEETVPDSGVYTAGPLILNFGGGGGIGVETVFFEHFAVGTEFVYVVMYNYNENNIDVNMYPQVSIRYRF